MRNFFPIFLGSRERRSPRVCNKYSIFQEFKQPVYFQLFPALLLKSFPPSQIQGVKKITMTVLSLHYTNKEPTAALCIQAININYILTKKFISVFPDLEKQKRF